MLGKYFDSMVDLLITSLGNVVLGGLLTASMQGGGLQSLGDQSA
ncbi:hypothetical protein RQCS_58740 (plasmid) [Rhodococcus qingshengii]|nr:hypothetical protein [Rhodococcus qingshengii]BCF86329.1 hypothetical protein RQCS_58740 [Rhodococcus qingshengii]